MSSLHLFRLLLAVTCCFAGRLSSAQQVAIPLLVSKVPLVTEPAIPPAAPAASSVVPLPAKRYLHPSNQVLQSPLVLLNSRFIIGWGFLQTVEVISIEKVMVYKGQDTPLPWRILAANGVVDITFKKKMRVKSWTFTKLGHRLGLQGPICYFINDLPMADGNLRIARQAIGEVKVARVAAGSILSVKTLEAPAKNYPFGTIMLRGIAIP